MGFEGRLYVEYKYAHWLATLFHARTRNAVWRRESEAELPTKAPGHLTPAPRAQLAASTAATGKLDPKKAGY